MRVDKNAKNASDGIASKIGKQLKMRKKEIAQIFREMQPFVALER